MRLRTDSLAIAGWLFADMLLGLAIIFLGSSSQTDGYILEEQPFAGASTTMPTTTLPEPESEPSTTTLAPIEGLDPQPFLLEVPDVDVVALTAVGSDRREAEADRIEAVVRRELADRIDDGTPVGIALTFGVDIDVGEGQVLAAAFNTVLEERVPELFSGAALRSFDFRASAGQGTARSELYFFVRD